MKRIKYVMFLLSCFSITFFSCQRKKDVGLNINNVECIDSPDNFIHYFFCTLNMKNIFLLLPLLSLLTSCLFSHGDLCTFYCEEADFTFSVHQRGDANVLIFSSYDSVFSRPSKSGSYYGIDFYYLKDDSTIFIKGESAHLEKGKDSTLNLVIPSPYKIISHKYKIKYLQQNVDWRDPNFLKYDDSILGNDYWWFKGNVCDWAGAYSFSYGHSSNKDAKLLEAQSPPLNFFIRAFPSHEHKEVTGEDSASPMVRR